MENGWYLEIREIYKDSIGNNEVLISSICGIFFLEVGGIGCDLKICQCL